MIWISNGSWGSPCGACRQRGAAGSNLKILAVTILTSLDRQDLDNAMIKDGDIPDLVFERAGRAFDAGADGVIASPQESGLIRALPESQGRLIVTPGVRPAGADLGTKTCHNTGRSDCKRIRSHCRWPPHLARG